MIGHTSRNSDKVSFRALERTFTARPALRDCAWKPLGFHLPPRGNFRFPDPFPVQVLSRNSRRYVPSRGLGHNSRFARSRPRLASRLRRDMLRLSSPHARKAVCVLRGHNEQSESWCPREDLNLYPFRDMVLSHARIPIPPRGHFIQHHFLSERWCWIF